MKISSIEADAGAPWLHQPEKAARIAVLAMIAVLLVIGVISARETLINSGRLASHAGRAGRELEQWS